MPNKRHRFKGWKPKKKRKPAGGRVELKSTGVAVGLIPADDEPEVQPPPPPPPSGGITFASFLNEARVGLRDNATNQRTNQKRALLEKEAAAHPKRTGREPQVLNQPVADGHPNDKEDELDKHEEGIEGAHKTFTTAVFLCEKQHVGLVCHWSDSDPVNRKGTWRLEKFDCRNDPVLFNNGVEDHETCVPVKCPDLLNELARRMIEEFETHKHKAHITEREGQGNHYQNDGTPKTKSPPLEKVVRALGDLFVYFMEDTNEKNDEGKKGTDESGGNGEKGAKTVVKTAKTAGREVELSRLRRLMEEQAQARIADQKRIERKAIEQRQAQRDANGANALDTLFKTKIGPDSTGNHNHSKASKLQAKKDQATVEADRRKCEQELKEKRRKPKPEKVVAKPHLTEAERKALRHIEAAQKQEVDELEQAERDEKKRLLQLAAEVKTTGGKAVEDETDDDLAKAVEEAIENVSPKDSPDSKTSAKIKQKKTAGSKRTATESATDGPDDQNASPPAKKQKMVTKRRERPIIENSSEESDSVNAPKASTNAIKTEALKTPTRKLSLADYLAVKAAKADTKIGQETKRTEKKNGKTHKSEAIVTDSDLENDAEDNVELLTDKLKSKKMGIETTSTGKATTTTKKDGNIVEEVVETTTVAVHVDQEDGSTERTEVTETTVVASDSSEQGEITIEHITHTHTVAGLMVPERELPRNSPPPSPERELGDSLDIRRNAMGIDFTVTPPTNSPASSTLGTGVSPSLKKRKLEETPRSELESEHEETPSSPKKRRVADDSPASEGPGLESSLPTSPGAVSATSSTPSSSEKKRKMPWSEEDGEVTINPGGTKRVKRVQSGNDVNGYSTQEDSYGEGGKAEEAGDVVMEGEDSDSDYDSLFDSPKSESGKEL